MIVVLSKRKLAIKLVVKVLQNSTKKGRELERGERGGTQSCLHHQLTVDSRAIKDTAVKAAHQINDNNSQKFLSRSLKKKERKTKNASTAPQCDVISSAYASHKPSQAKPGQGAGGRAEQKAKLAIGEDRRTEGNGNGLMLVMRVGADDDDSNGERESGRERERA